MSVATGRTPPGREHGKSNRNIPSSSPGNLLCLVFRKCIAFFSHISASISIHMPRNPFMVSSSDSRIGMLTARMVSFPNTSIWLAMA